FNNDVRDIGVVSTDYGIAIVEVLDKKTSVRPVVVKLTKEIHTQASVAMQLKDKRTWGESPIYLKTDNKFKAVPIGYRSNEGQFVSGNELAMFWTQSINEEGLAATVYLVKNVESLEANYFDKEIGIPVRCIKEK
ncbi:MAG TPA: FISUMP domain-containing protein, partial [Brumimicrobium sp.]|nr:FISUMP domain-containing protein [Brumimicrobium sp.]